MSQVKVKSYLQPLKTIRNIRKHHIIIFNRIKEYEAAYIVYYTNTRIDTISDFIFEPKTLKATLIKLLTE